MKRHLKALALGAALLLPVAAQAQQANNYWCIVGTLPCPPGSWTPVSPANPLPITTIDSGPGTATTTTSNSTISVTNTFQPALAASATRKSCTIQNTGTHVEYFYFGAIGSATTSNGLQVNAGQTISCATINGLVLVDAVNITGTAGDGYVVNSQ